MAVPVYSASPINGNAPASPSTFAMRYTPASALDEQLAATANSPPSLTSASSASTTPSPEPTVPAQRANTQAHASNDISPTSAPIKAQPTQATSPTRQQSSTQPSLGKLSIPSTPLTINAQPVALSPYAPSPISTTPSHTHSRHVSSISGISQYSTSPFLMPSMHRDLSNPPGYVQNTRESFEDRIISQDPEEQSFLVSPRGHKSRTSFGGGLLDGNYRDPVSARDDGRDGELGRLWETASEWAKLAAKKLGDRREGGF